MKKKNEEIKVENPAMSKSMTKRLKESGADTSDWVASETFLSPESSNVEGGTYDPVTLQVVLGFRDKKNPTAPTVFYSYDGVNRADWEGLKTAQSKGTHMSKIFTKRYRGVLIG